MPVKIRLARRGRRKAPFYHIIIADARAPRDGKFIEKIGSYNPMTKPATIELDREKALDWLQKGAQPTDTVRAMLRFKGVMYRKHLLRGVTKGALTMEKADQLYKDFVDAKESKIESRREETRKEIEAFHKAVSGTPGKVKAAPVVDESAVAAFQEGGEAEAPAKEEAKAEAPAKEEAKAEAPAKEEAKAEAPAKEEAKAEAPAKEEAKPEAPAKEEAKAEAPAEEAKADDNADK